MGEQRPLPRATGGHFLGPRFATELVRAFDIGPAETVVEIGAGSGRLTRELVRVAGVVLALELDPVLARTLVGGRGSSPNLFVHRGDALDAVLPPTPFRVVGNVPFGISTALLRRFLHDDRSTRADLIVQLELARKHAAARGHLSSVIWAIEWDLTVRRRIPARCFHPAPSVEAAWLSAVRRTPPLLPRHERPAFERLVRRAFGRAGLPVRRSLDVAPIVLRRAGVDADARAVDLHVRQWVRLFLRTRPPGSKGARGHL